MENLKSKNVLRVGIDFTLKSIFDEINNPIIQNWNVVESHLLTLKEYLRTLYSININEYYDRKLYLENKEKSGIKFNSKNVEKSIKERMNDLSHVFNLYKQGIGREYNSTYEYMIEEKINILGKYINAGASILQFIDDHNRIFHFTDDNARKSLNDIIDKACIMRETLYQQVFNEPIYNKLIKDWDKLSNVMQKVHDFVANKAKENKDQI